MRVRLAYGQEGLEVHLPETEGFQGVLRGRTVPSLAAPEQALCQALREPIGSAPLGERVRAKTQAGGPGTRAVVVISDITRPVPNALLLPPVLQTLEQNGVAREAITLLVATGIHRPNEGEELIRLLGREIAARYRVDNHRSKQRDEMVHCGRSSKGIPLELNRQYVEADIRVLTGFIEPHMWAGYSGGRKALLPGVSSLETMRHMHGYAMVADPGTRYGQLEGNPFHEAGLEVLGTVGADFLVNVTLDSDKRVTGWWCGDAVEAHLAGCRFLEQSCVVELDAPLDFAVTTNGGAPLDCNLYQTTKGVAGAVAAVRAGGAIVVASACPEGAGGEEYTALVEGIESPQALLEQLQQPGFFVADQWCAQEMWQSMLSRQLLIKCEGLDATWLKDRGLTPVRSVEEAVGQLLERYGPQARWAVIPEGPLTITRTRMQPA